MAHGQARGGGSSSSIGFTGSRGAHTQPPGRQQAPAGSSGSSDSHAQSGMRGVPGGSGGMEGAGGGHGGHEGGRGRDGGWGGSRAGAWDWGAVERCVWALRAVQDVPWPAQRSFVLLLAAFDSHLVSSAVARCDSD